jgi:alkylated DNA repair dioxygenase AlkB
MVIFSEAKGMSSPPDGFCYFPNFLDLGEGLELSKRLGELPFEHPVARGRRLRRGHAQFGHAYVTARRRLVPAPPMPEFLTALIARALPLCPPGTRFDQCIVTEYPAGAGIGWHTDAPHFGGCIMGVSLGAEARLLFRENGQEKPCYRLSVAPGSLYLLGGPARWEYQHKVAPVKATRYSLTFRYVYVGAGAGSHT